MDNVMAVLAEFRGCDGVLDRVRFAFLEKVSAAPRIFRAGIFEGACAEQVRKNIAWKLKELEAANV